MHYCIVCGNVNVSIIFVICFREGIVPVHSLRKGLQQQTEGSDPRPATLHSDPRLLLVWGPVPAGPGAAAPCTGR